MRKFLNGLLDLLANPLVYGIILFIIFAKDLEHNRDVWTWMWLLAAQLNLMKWAITEIRKK